VAQHHFYWRNLILVVLNLQVLLPDTYFANCALHLITSQVKCVIKKSIFYVMYEDVSKSFRTGRLERELQMVQLSATRYNCIAIL
jgi:hypothetical protein